MRKSHPSGDLSRRSAASGVGDSLRVDGAGPAPLRFDEVAVIAVAIPAVFDIDLGHRTS
jgi:hypothetical protein